MLWLGQAPARGGSCLTSDYMCRDYQSGATEATQKESGPALRIIAGAMGMRAKA